MLLAALPVVVLGVALLLFAPVGPMPAVKPPLPKVFVPVSRPDTGPERKYSAVLSVTAGNVSDASEVVRKELARTRAERDAFEEFHRRVESTPATRGSAVLDSRHTTAAATARQGREPGNLPRVRRAYVETVMAVDHHDDEYDETLAESVAEEFGPEIGSLLVFGRSFTPIVKDQFLRAAGESRRVREGYSRRSRPSSKHSRTPERRSIGSATGSNG